MPLSAADLSRIEALARKAMPGRRSAILGGNTFDFYVQHQEGELLAAANENEAEFIAALDPGTVLALVEAARRGMAAPVVIAYCPPEPEPADDDD